MGKIFGGLTNQTLTDPSSGGGTTYNPSPQQIASSFQGQVAPQASPMPSSVDNSTPTYQPPQDPSAPSQATLSQPSFMKAMNSGPAGMANVASPQLSTKGKVLASILQGAQGAVAGYAAGRQGNPRDGYGGPAAGFQAGMQLPFMQAQQRQEIQHGALQNQQLQAQTQFLPQILQMGLQKTGAQISKDTSTAAKNNAQTAALPATTALKQAQTLAANYKTQNGILYNVATGKPLTPDATGMVEVPADIAGALDVAPGTKLPAQQITAARNAIYGHLASTDPVILAQIGQPPVNDENALAAWGQKAEAIKEKMNAAGRIAGAGARYVQVADPNNPGNVTYMPAAEAGKTGAMAPSSAPSITAKKTAAAIAPGGKVGEEINAFNTAVAHADLLTQAIGGLQNGNTQLLNSLKNRFNNQFGESGPITAQAISDAYTREVTKMLSAGHMTDSEIGTVGKTLDTNSQSPEQSLGVINAYKQLALSKMAQRQRQVEMGQQGKAAFPTSGQGGVTVQDPRGVVHTFPDQASANKFKQAAGIQ